MKIPEVVRVGSADYQVCKTNEVILQNNTECYGDINYDHHKIRLNTENQDKQTLEISFLHELGHAIIHERQLDIESKLEEKIVEAFAYGLHQIIRDNKEIFEH